MSRHRNGTPARTLLCGIAAFAGVVAASTQPPLRAVAVAQAPSGGVLGPQPCGYPPPTPAPIFTLLSPHDLATGISLDAPTIVIAALPSAPYAVALTSRDGVVVPLAKAAPPVTFSPPPDAHGTVEAYVLGRLRPATVYVVTVLTSHWIPKAPCVGTVVFTAGTFTTKGLAEVHDPSPAPS
jgi:hypothetical protein